MSNGWRFSRYDWYGHKNFDNYYLDIKILREVEGIVTRVCHGLDTLKLMKNWAIVLCPMLINNDFGIPLVVLILIDVAKNRFPSSKPACRTLATVELSSQLPRRLQCSTPGWWWWWWWWWWKFLTKTILSFETRSLYSGCRRSRHTSWARWSGTLGSQPEHRFS